MVLKGSIILEYYERSTFKIKFFKFSFYIQNLYKKIIKLLVCKKKITKKNFLIEKYILHLFCIQFLWQLDCRSWVILFSLSHCKKRKKVKYSSDLRLFLILYIKIVMKIKRFDNVSGIQKTDEYPRHHSTKWYKEVIWYIWYIDRANCIAARTISA